MSVTPDFIGQDYKDTNNGNVWKANSLASGDWNLEVQEFQLKWTPTSAILPELIPVRVDTQSSGIVTLEFSIPTQSGGLEFSYFQNLTTISFPNLVSVDPAYSGTGTLTIRNNPVLTAINLPLLQSAGGQINIQNSALTTLSLPSFVSSGDGILIANNSSLSSISLPLWEPTDGFGHTFTSNALDASTVNAILARGVAKVAFVSGSINVSGGTNAAPTGQGITDKNTLIARGVIVTTN